MTRSLIMNILLLAAIVPFHPSEGFAQPSTVSSASPAVANATAVLFQNVRVFDGKSDHLIGPTSVLVVDNKISAISDSIAAPANATVIEGGGRVLMPGLIDAHVHICMASVPMLSLLTGDASYTHLLSGKEAEATLMRGFTTVRDLGGPVFGLKRAIDEGKLPGPRIYPSGSMISQSGGHGDFRQRWEVPRKGGELSRAEELGATRIADGVPEVTRAVRENLMLGASQIKLMAGGGVSSLYDPLDVTQYTEEELKAAVQAAENWGTYVCTHVYTSKGIQLAIKAGVKCIEHGHLMDEETAMLIAEKGIWLSMQPFLDDEDANPKENPVQRQKQLQVSTGTDQTYRLAHKHKLKLAWGTDTLHSEKLARRQGAQLVKLARWFRSHEVLKIATANNAQLLAMSGERNPYPGKLGVVEEGALADLILVDGDPLQDLTLIADPGKNFLVIMKDGKIYKNLVR